MAARPRSHNIDVPNLYQKLDKRSGKVYYQYRDSRTGRFHGLGTDKKRAVSIAKELNERIAQQLIDHYQTILDQNVPKVKTKGISTKTWCQRYIKIIKEKETNNELSPFTVNQRIRHTNILIRRLGTTGIRDIDTKSLATIFDEYCARGKRSMARSLRSSWVDIFKEAQHAGEVDGNFNPATSTKVPHVKILRGRLRRTDWPALVLSAKQQSLLYPLHALYLGITTGLRRSDLCNLKFTDVKDDHLFVKLSKARGQTKLAFPLTLTSPLTDMTLADIIEMCRSTGIKSDYLLHQTGKNAPERRGKRILPNGLSMAFKELRDASGLSWDSPSPPSFHEIRSLAERIYSEHGYDTQTLLGHKTRKMTDRYHDARGSEYTFITPPK
ncbi:integrase [Veronia nyctiphanis]|uniref:Integrase n=1 Tax=Veronia nyctiphanis TaxID=1278244 RepID=A0A4Q0YE04_9GAMM|nr:phage integrase Arm DNA-binding domain-containing protein [Veronia nyctiphanis]RXJ68710.1 integrase [Veronia nyctiphanis]